MPQAIEWSLATPMTSPRLPTISPLASVMFCAPRHAAQHPSPFQPLEGENGIRSTEAEAVGNRHVDAGIVDALHHDRRIIDGGIEVVDVRTFADEAVMHHEKRVDRLVHAGRALAVAAQRLGGTDRRDSPPKHLADRVDLR